jgi:cystathionine beta-lyase/cystathionine gamma-synthase
MSDDDDLKPGGFETRAIHAGQSPDAATFATIVPIYQTSTYTQPAIGEHKGFEYSRGRNPTRDALEACLASLEGGRFGLAYASGMAAITGVCQLLSAGDHVVVADDLYGGTYRLFNDVLSRFGVDFSWVDATHIDAVAQAVRPETRFVWIESPTNPMLRLIDVVACAEIARNAGARLVVDNTFATPFLQNPLALGAHIVVHSTTKWIGGHSDVIGGAVVIDDEAVNDELQFTRNTTGGVPSPFDAWLTLRGVKTLSLRMREHQRNAQRVAEFLLERPDVTAVYYPGLPSHPGHALAKRQMRGFGAVVTFDIRGGEDAARRFCNGTRLFSLAEGLGGIESMIGYPFLMSHGSFPAEAKRSKGITEATIRLAVGIEDVDDILADLDHAFRQAASGA